MRKRSPGHKRYHMQRLDKDILTLNLDDLVVDCGEDESIQANMVTDEGIPGLDPREYITDGPSDALNHRLNSSQIQFLKESLKDFPSLIKEMNI